MRYEIYTAMLSIIQRAVNSYFSVFYWVLPERRQRGCLVKGWQLEDLQEMSECQYPDRELWRPGVLEGQIALWDQL